MTPRVLRCCLRVAALLVAAATLLAGLLPAALAHDIPPSTLDLRANAAGVQVSLSVPGSAALHGSWPVAPPVDAAVSSRDAARQKAQITAFLAERLVLQGDGSNAPLVADVQTISATKDRTEVRLHYAWDKPPRVLLVRCRLFPDDPQHRTFVNIRRDGRLERQEVLGSANNEIRYRPGTGQETLAVVGEFFAQGVHHIFIGPDHILFIIGLLLLGGGLKPLLKIVTTFTIAHSITLALATFEIVRLPPRLVESTIALSIVFVGVHALLNSSGNSEAEQAGGAARRGDVRLLFAFGFGLIHGFGFASVLGDLDLPRQGVGWSLFAFNLGVEAGQAAIVLFVAPLLALLRLRSSALVARQVVLAGALVVIAAGAYWFAERAFLPG